MINYTFLHRKHTPSTYPSPQARLILFPLGGKLYEGKEGALLLCCRSGFSSTIGNRLRGEKGGGGVVSLALVHLVCVFAPESRLGCVKHQGQFVSRIMRLSTHSSRSGLSCREYILYSNDELKSSLPFSTSALVADSIGCGRPMDSRKETARSRSGTVS
ncbi:hypothetical protein F5Y10DRAFT_211074 [Nemania abortiva]|nr:hypothetical protein F5Y10DRAFT_211074 [Nemania abortiva]